MIRAEDQLDGIYKEPETPEELAQLKAVNSLKRRKNHTINNLIIAIVACLAAMAVLWMTVWRPNGSIIPEIDYEQAVAQSQVGYSQDILTPELPEGWRLNAANVRTDPTDKQRYWYLGILTEEEHFIALLQRFDADDTWPIRVMDSTFPTGATTISDHNWQEFDRRNDKNASGNKPYGLVYEHQDYTLILHGTATDEEFVELINHLALE